MNNKIKQKASYLPQGVTTAGGSACFVRVRCQIQALKGCMSPAGTEQVPFDFPSICVNHYTTGGSSSYTKILMGKKKTKKEKRKYNNIYKKIVFRVKRSLTHYTIVQLCKYTHTHSTW